MGLFVSLHSSGTLRVAKRGNYVLENGFLSKGNGVFRPKGPYGPPIYGLGVGE